MSPFRLNLGQPEQQTLVESTPTACAGPQESIREVSIAEASCGSRITAGTDVLCLQRPRCGDCVIAQAEGQHVTLEQFRIGDVCLWKGRVASGRAAELLQLPRIIESDLLAGRYEGVFLLIWCSDAFRFTCLTLLAAMPSQDDCD